MKYEIIKMGMFEYAVLIQTHANTPWVHCGSCRTLRGAKKFVNMIGKVLSESAKKQNQG